MYFTLAANVCSVVLASGASVKCVCYIVRVFLKQDPLQGSVSGGRGGTCRQLGAF